MKAQHSLRFRITASFTLAGALMGLVFGTVVYGYLHDSEDKLIENQMRYESDAFLRDLSAGKSDTPPRTNLIAGYLGHESIPPHFRAFVQKKQEGIYEIGDDIHLMVTPVPGKNDLFYLFHKDKEVDPLENSDLVDVLLIALVLATVLTGWFGHLIAKRMIAPVVNLANQVETLEPTQEPTKIKGAFYQDEVGSLARAFEGAMNRVAEFVERERRFTRDASHELRTPVTVIKGAAELIGRNEDQGRPIATPLRRLDRAVKDMEHIIETFLYLGRQGSLPEKNERYPIHIILEEVVEANRYILEDKPVILESQLVDDFEVSAPEALVRIAVNNLVRNACQYTDQGSVTVLAHQYQVVITDTGRGMTPNEVKEAQQRETRGNEGEGFGLGLSIVKDFCERYGWRLAIESRQGKGTRISLDFSETSPGTTKP